MLTTNFRLCSFGSRWCEPDYAFRWYEPDYAWSELGSTNILLLKYPCCFSCSIISLLFGWNAENRVNMMSIFCSRPVVLIAAYLPLRAMQSFCCINCVRQRWTNSQWQISTVFCLYLVCEHLCFVAWQMSHWWVCQWYRSHFLIILGPMLDCLTRGLSVVS
jgi:hypothetical protein